jgi:hypothetical protein
MRIDPTCSGALGRRGAAEACDEARKDGYKLGRSPSTGGRCSGTSGRLFRHERIETTEAKAKACAGWPTT